MKRPGTFEDGEDVTPGLNDDMADQVWLCFICQLLVFLMLLEKAMVSLQP